MWYIRTRPEISLAKTLHSHLHNAALLGLGILFDKNSLTVQKTVARKQSTLINEPARQQQKTKIVACGNRVFPFHPSPIYTEDSRYSQGRSWLGEVQTPCIKHGGFLLQHVSWGSQTRALSIRSKLRARYTNVNECKRVLANELPRAGASRQNADRYYRWFLLFYNYMRREVSAGTF